MAATSPLSSSSLTSSSSSSNLSMNATVLSSASASPASALASCTTSTDCQKAHQGAIITTATQKQQQKRRQRRHLYAQKLNNSAASCIEIGQYDRAISSLSKALQLSEQEQPDDEEEGNEQGEDEMMTICSCYHCTVDGCIEYSEKNPHVMTKDDPFVCVAVAVAGETNTDADTDADADADSSYIYRRPIQVTPRSIQEGHNMGSSLCLLISFNLALAYHLKAAITTTTTTTNNKNNKKRYMTVALKLYTHVIRWQTRLMHQQFLEEGTSSMMSSTEASFHNMRLKMVLLNNMSQIHRCDIITCTTDNKDRKHKHHEKSYTMCLELLLSSIMLVVEYKTRISSSSSSLPYIMSADLERFLQNTSPLLMGRSNYRRRNGGCVQDQCCASAA